MIDVSDVGGVNALLLASQQAGSSPPKFSPLPLSPDPAYLRPPDLPLPLDQSLAPDAGTLTSNIPKNNALLQLAMVSERIVVAEWFARTA